jgi:hypothetical protein
MVFECGSDILHEKQGLMTTKYRERKQSGLEDEISH